MLPKIRQERDESSVDKPKIANRISLKVRFKSSSKRLGLTGTYQYARRTFELELLICLFMIGKYLCIELVFRVKYQMACYANLEFSDELCSAIVSGKMFGNETEFIALKRLTSHEHLWNGFVSNVISACLTLIYGPFSDRYNARKPFIILPIIGQMIGSVGLILCSIYRKTMKVEFSSIFGQIIPAVFGGFHVFAMAIFALMSDRCIMEKQTMRISILNFLIVFTFIMTRPISVILVDHVDDIHLLGAGLILMWLSLCFCCLCVRDDRQHIRDFRLRGIRGVGDLFKDTREIFMLLKTGTIEANAKFLWCSLVCVFFQSGAKIGDYNFDLMQFYGWTRREYNIYISIVPPVTGICSLVAMILFFQYYKFQDYSILIMAYLNSLVTILFKLFAVSHIAFYIASGVGFLEHISVVLRALLTKLVIDNHTAKAHALFSLSQVAARGFWIGVSYPLLIVDEHLYGAPYLMKLFCYSIITPLAIWMYLRSARARTEYDEELDDIEGNTNYLFY